MPRFPFVVYAEDECVALAGKENLNGIMGVAAFREEMELGKAGLFEKLEFGYVFRNRHIAVAFFYEKLFEHLVGIAESGAGKSGAVFPAIAAAKEIIAACLGELLPHRHMRLRGRSVFGRSGRAVFLPFFCKAKFIVVQQSGSKFEQKYTTLLNLFIIRGNLKQFPGIGDLV
jgi:hypothetical protein